MRWKHGHAKPVIGIIGGIGSGKSAVAGLFAREGCAVIDSDALAHDVIQSPEVKAELRQWLIRQGLSVRYTGCDLTPAVLHEARRRQPGADLLLADLFHAAPFPPRAFDVTFSSGLFNLELGNNEAFLDEALPILARLTRRRLVVNLLHVRTEQKYPLCHYFDPDDIRRRFAGLGRGLDVIDDYLPNDFTLVWHLPEGKA